MLCNNIVQLDCTQEEEGKKCRISQIKQKQNFKNRRKAASKDWTLRIQEELTGTVNCGNSTNS